MQKNVYFLPLSLSGPNNELSSYFESKVKIKIKILKKENLTNCRCF